MNARYLAMMDWKQRAIYDGKGFHFQVGTLSTPVVGGGDGTVIDLDQPEVVISVPAGKTICPLRIQVVAATPLIAADSNESEILVTVDKDTSSTDGTWANTVTPVNMQLGRSGASSCTVKTVCSADCTDPTHDMDLAHKQVTADLQGTAANALWGELELLYEPAAPPFLEGTCGLYVYWGGTVATNAFAHIQYLEFDS